MGFDLRSVEGEENSRVVREKRIENVGVDKEAVGRTRYDPVKGVVETVNGLCDV